jgi:hypothetical protein
MAPMGERLARLLRHRDSLLHRIFRRSNNPSLCYHLSSTVATKHCCPPLNSMGVRSDTTLLFGEPSKDSVLVLIVTRRIS